MWRAPRHSICRDVMFDNNGVPPNPMQAAGSLAPAGSGLTGKVFPAFFCRLHRVGRSAARA